MKAIVTTIDEDFEKSRTAGAKDKNPRKKRSGKGLSGKEAKWVNKFTSKLEQRKQMAKERSGLREALTKARTPGAKDKQPRKHRGLSNSELVRKLISAKGKHQRLLNAEGAGSENYKHAADKHMSLMGEWTRRTGKSSRDYDLAHKYGTLMTHLEERNPSGNK